MTMTKKVEWYKIKNGNSTIIKEPSFLEREELLDKGYVVSCVTTNDNKTHITTYSPKTKEEAMKEEQKAVLEAAKRVSDKLNQIHYGEEYDAEKDKWKRKANHKEKVLI